MKGHFRLMPLSAMPSIISFLTCLCSCTHSNTVTLICPDPFPLPCILHMNQRLSQCLEQGTLLRGDNTMLTNQEGLLFLPHHFRSLICLLCLPFHDLFPSACISGSYSVLWWLHLFFSPMLSISLSMPFTCLCVFLILINVLLGCITRELRAQGDFLKDKTKTTALLKSLHPIYP